MNNWCLFVFYCPFSLHSPDSFYSAIFSSYRQLWRTKVVCTMVFHSLLPSSWKVITFSSTKCISSSVGVKGVQFFGRTLSEKYPVWHHHAAFQGTGAMTEHESFMRQQLCSACVFCIGSFINTCLSTVHNVMMRFAVKVIIKLKFRDFSDLLHHWVSYIDSLLSVWPQLSPLQYFRQRRISLLSRLGV